MTIEDQIKDKKLQYDINREAAKISALSSGNLDKYEYLTGEEILPSNQQYLHSDLPFLPERMIINNTKKLVCNLNDKKNYIVHINVLKQALDRGLKLRKVHRIIEFEQEAWLKEYIDVNMELRKRSN